MAGSLGELQVGILDGPGPAIDILFWTHWETAVSGKILARSLLEPDCGNLAPFSWLWQLPCEGQYVPNPAQELLGALKGPRSTGKATPGGGPGTTGKEPGTTGKVPGFRVYTFVIATSVRVITSGKQLGGSGSA